MSTAKLSPTEAENSLPAEKRKNPRYVTENLEIRYKISPDDPIWRHARVRNISLGGLKLEVPESPQESALNPEQPLLLQLVFPSSLRGETCLLVSGQVVRQDQSHLGARACGVRLDELDEQDHGYLVDFLVHLLQEGRARSQRAAFSI